MLKYSVTVIDCDNYCYILQNTVVSFKCLRLIHSATYYTMFYALFGSNKCKSRDNNLSLILFFCGNSEAEQFKTCFKPRGFKQRKDTRNKSNRKKSINHKEREHSVYSSRRGEIIKKYTEEFKGNLKLETWNTIWRLNQV